MQMNPIEPRYRIDGGHTVVAVEARCLMLENRNRQDAGSVRTIRGCSGTARISRVAHERGRPLLLELTPPVLRSGHGCKRIKGWQ
jgi:hypothetical protein